MIIQYINRQSSYQTGSARTTVRLALEQAEKTWRQQPQDFEYPFQIPADTRLQVSVSFTGPRVMRKINRETRGVDRLTDVLSFPLLNMQDGSLRQPLGVQDYEHAKQCQLPLGDLLICLEQAHRQALEYGHCFEREVAFLAVHGFLHLLGYDHDQADVQRERKMRQLEEQILETVGLDRIQPDKRSSP